MAVTNAERQKAYRKRRNVTTAPIADHRNVTVGLDQVSWATPEHLVKVDAWAAAHAVDRSAAIRLLVERGLTASLVFDRQQQEGRAAQRPDANKSLVDGLGLSIGPVAQKAGSRLKQPKGAKA